MISAADLIHLPYSRDLTEGGIAYALRSLPYLSHQAGESIYDALRHRVAGAAVQLAFRRYLSEQEIPFDVRGAVPFTEHERYDVSLGGQRCDIQAFLVSDRERISDLRGHPETLLKAPALVASDQHAGEGHSSFDLYLFAFLTGQVTTLLSELRKVIEAQGPYALVYGMPETWNRPRSWNPLGPLVLKSESGEPQTIEIGGQDEARQMQTCRVELAPRTRLELPNRFFSLSYVYCQSLPNGRIGLHSPLRRETLLIGPRDWGNIWVYGMDLWLAGYIRRDEFSRRASFAASGSRVFQSDSTHVKNLGLPVSDLKPLSELFRKVRENTPQNGD